MKTRTARRAVLALLSSLIATTVTPMTRASAAPGDVTFGIQPASAKAADARPYFSFGATPGAVINDHVALVNLGLKSLSLSVYATDAQPADDGGITFLPASTKPVDAGTWITPKSKATVVVPPRNASNDPGVVIVPIQLKVPTTATPGDHVAAVVASLVVMSKDRNGTPVRLDQRVVTRAYIRVSGVVNARLRVEHVKLATSQTINPVGTTSGTLSWTVRNSGNVLLSADQKVSVSGLLGGSRTLEAPPTIDRLLPGGTVRFSIPVKDIKPGLRLSASITLEPRAAVESTVNGKLSPVRGHASVWSWYALAVVLLVLALIGFRIHRRWFAPWEDTSDTPNDDAEPSLATSAVKP